MLYLCLYHLSERILMLYPGLSHLAKREGTRPLLSIPGDQISMLYAFTIHPKGADLNALCLYHLFPESRSSIAWMPKSVSKAFIIHFSGADLNALCIYHPSRGSRSYIPKLVSRAFIIHFRGTNLNAPLTSLSSIPGEQIT